MRFTTRQTLKRCLIAVAATLAGLLAMAGTSQAAVSAAPDITASPANPNTTKAVVSFTYKVGTGETSTATTLRYYCRVYDSDGTPPAAGTGWAACGTTTSTDPQPASKTYAQANGNWTFEVAVRETTAIGTQGPIATSGWTQNITAPTKAAVITSQPDDPTITTSSDFAYTAGDGETDLVDRFQCRLDSTEASDWTSCGASGRSYTPGNGQHTFEVRAGNLAGWGPSSETATWTVDVPNSAVSVPIESVASTVWHRSTSSGAATYTNIGDFNGDGLDDFVVASSSAGDPHDVVFGSTADVGDRVLGSQDQSEGFRITSTALMTVLQAVIFSAGDVNGDGFDDLLMQEQGFDAGFQIQTLTHVIYGRNSVGGLPACGSGPARCLNAAALTSSDGFDVTGAFMYSGESHLVGGDFDGDGIDDLYLARQTAFVDSSWLIVKGSASRTGTVDVGALPDSQVLRIDGPENMLSGSSGPTSLGDIDGDGRDDVLLASTTTGESLVLYGRAFGDPPVHVSEVGPDQALRVYSPSLGNLWMASVGDIDGDGRPELAGSSITPDDPSQTVTVYKVPERGSDGYIALGEEVEPGAGYVVNRGSDLTSAVGAAASSGLDDLNNDGSADALVSAPATPVDGLENSGVVYALFGQNPFPSDPLGVGPSLTPDLGVGLTGTAGSQLGRYMTSLGDIDGDGLTDFGVLAPMTAYNGVTNAGSFYVVKSKSLINQVKTGKAAGVGNDSVVLNAGLSTNNRDSDVWFEYGTTDEYGESTDPESFEGSNTGDAALAAISGLAKNTTYHYRAVAKNELGLVRYGDDRTFKTTNTTDPGGNPCDLDNTKPGCDKYDPCKVDNTKPGCSDYCSANPGKCTTTGPARLALISTTKKINVKRGKKASLSVAVVNTGGKAASGVKLCVKAPKKLVKVKKCTKIGKLASGKTRVVKVKVKAKRKKGKAVLKLTASGNKLSAKKAKAKVVVR